MLACFTDPNDHTIRCVCPCVVCPSVFTRVCLVFMCSTVMMNQSINQPSNHSSINQSYNYTALFCVMYIYRQISRNSDNQKVQLYAQFFSYLYQWILQLLDLQSNKPKREVRDLNLNEATMGVYRLKSEKYYNVPDKDRVTSQNILQEIADTKNRVNFNFVNYCIASHCHNYSYQMLDLKMRFNKKIICLKRERKSLMSDITEDDGNSANEDEEIFDDYLFRVSVMIWKL